MTKPFTKLKRVDFENNPIWEWIQDESNDEDEIDESFVQPTEHIHVPTEAFAQFIVAANIELKDGSLFPGIAEVTVADSNAAIQPTVVFMLDRKLQIPGLETNRLLTRYTQSLDNYPVGWKLNVLIEGEQERRSGEIKGGDLGRHIEEAMQQLLDLNKLLRAKQ